MEPEKTIRVNMKEEMADELERRAGSMHLSTSEYVILILMHWPESGEKVQLQEQ